MQNINLLNLLGIDELLEFILLFPSTPTPLPPQYFKCRGTAMPSYGSASCVCSWSSLLCHFHSRTSLRLSLFSIQLSCQFKYETFSFNFQKNVSNHASPSEFSLGFPTFCTQQGRLRVCTRHSLPGWSLPNGSLGDGGPLSVRVMGCEGSWGVSACTGACQNSGCQGALGSGPPESCPDQRHTGIVLAALGVMWLLVG